MLPTAIVREARSRGLDVIGICDHNSAENVGAVTRAGARESLSVVPGIEITTREEVHILGLFPDETAALGVQSVVYESLPGKNDQETYGYQVVVDDRDELLELNERLLIGATELTLEEVVAAIHAGGGLAIAAHIDRQSFGILGQLGFIPPGLDLDAVELSPHASFDAYEGFPVTTSSDAHALHDIGKSWTSFLVKAGSFDEIGSALLGQEGRAAVANRHG